MHFTIFIETTVLKEKADDTVDTYIEFVAQIIKDPMGVVESISQSVSDTVEEEGRCM